MSEPFLDRLLSSVGQLELRASESDTEIKRLKALVKVVEAKRGQYEVELKNVRSLIAAEKARQIEVDKGGDKVLIDAEHSLVAYGGLPDGSSPLLRTDRAENPTLHTHTNLRSSPAAPATAVQVHNSVHQPKQYAERSKEITGKTRSIPTQSGHFERLYPSATCSTPTPASFQHNILGHSELPSESQQPSAYFPSSPPASSQSIEETIASLPTPPRTRFPSVSVCFPNAFLEKALRISGVGFITFEGKKLEKQVFPCPALIRIGTEPYNELTPTPGHHGAVLLVEGQPGDGHIGEKYTIFRKSIRGWVYCGEYSLIRRMTVPLEFWMNYPDKSKRELATRINTTAWGQDLLRDKKVVEEEAIGKPDTVTMILDAFRRDINGLRMSWGVLEYVEYKHELYNALVAAVEKFIPPGLTSKKRLSSQSQRTGDTPENPPVSKVTASSSFLQLPFNNGNEDALVADDGSIPNVRGEEEDAAPTGGRRKRARLHDNTEPSSAKGRRDERGIRYNVDGADGKSE
ncbi:MAG: hypothetical protein M1835_007065 [Candelina submexicana]|nr:MAG: hypothetical protein M1835_007065 [Candelina submexicana]